jgi:hypothetical protein
MWGMPRPWKKLPPVLLLPKESLLPKANAPLKRVPSTENFKNKLLLNELVLQVLRAPPTVLTLLCMVQEAQLLFMEQQPLSMAKEVELLCMVHQQHLCMEQQAQSMLQHLLLRMLYPLAGQKEWMSMDEPIGVL